jgi:hypothetical protein
MHRLYAREGNGTHPWKANSKNTPLKIEGVRETKDTEFYSGKGRIYVYIGCFKTPTFVFIWVCSCAILFPNLIIHLTGEEVMIHGNSRSFVLDSILTLPPKAFVASIVVCVLFIVLFINLLLNESYPSRV